MPDIVDNIIKLKSLYVILPSIMDEPANIKAQSAAVSSFPNVIRAIDCTHVAIRAHTQNEAAFNIKAIAFSSCTRDFISVTGINLEGIHCNA